MAGNYAEVLQPEEAVLSTIITIVNTLVGKELRRMRQTAPFLILSPNFDLRRGFIRFTIISRRTILRTRTGTKMPKKTL